MKYRKPGATGLSSHNPQAPAAARCPFGVPVRENMAEAAKVFGY